MILYKIFEEKNGKLYNLFHGMEKGTREVIKHIRYKNRAGKIRDGGNNKYYDSGIHAHYKIESTQEWLSRFDDTNRHIYVCEGSVREPKATSDGKVALCDDLMIICRADDPRMLDKIFEFGYIEGHKDGHEEVHDYYDKHSF